MTYKLHVSALYLGHLQAYIWGGVHSLELCLTVIYKHLCFTFCIYTHKGNASHIYKGAVVCYNVLYQYVVCYTSISHVRQLVSDSGIEAVILSVRSFVDTCVVLWLKQFVTSSGHADECQPGTQKWATNLPPQPLSVYSSIIILSPGMSKMCIALYVKW
jgi:hypothetical protein